MNTVLVIADERIGGRVRILISEKEMKALVRDWYHRNQLFHNFCLSIPFSHMPYDPHQTHYIFVGYFPDMVRLEIR